MNPITLVGVSAVFLNTPLAHLPFICPPKFCISIVFNFSWDGCSTQEKWKTKVVQNFGGQIRCIMGDAQVVYLVKQVGYCHAPSLTLPPTLVLDAITVQTGIVKVYFSKKCMRIKIFVQIRTGANTQVCQRCKTRLDNREKCCRFTMDLSHLGKCQNLVCLLQQSYRIMKCSIHLRKKGLVTLKIPRKILNMQCELQSHVHVSVRWGVC